MGKMVSNFGASSCLALAFLLPSATQAGESKWDSNIELEFKPGNKRTIGEADLFMPVWQDERALAFVSMRGMSDTASNSEGNVGLGYRRILDDEWIVGGFGFFDLRGTQNGNRFLQGTIGVEVLSVDWDLRANGYIPESGEKEVSGTSGSAQAVLSGTSLRVVTNQGSLERALAGFNAEVGWRLPFEPAEIRIFGGGYWFGASGQEDVAGPRGRLELRFNDLDWFGVGSSLRFGIEGQWDDPRGGQVFGILRLRIPLGDAADRQRRWSKLTALERRMVERVERDVDVVTGTRVRTVDEPAIIDGREIPSVHVVGSNDDLENTVENLSGPDGLVIVDGIVSENDNVDLQRGQVLASGGTTFAVSGATSGAATTFTAPGAAGTIQKNGNRLALADDSLVTDLVIRGSGDGIVAQNVTNARINNVQVLMSNTGVSITDSEEISVNNVEVADSSGFGIFSCRSNNITLDSVTVKNAGSDGILLSQSADATLRDITVDGTGGLGISLETASGNSTVTNASVTGAQGLIGIRVSNSGSIALLDITVTNAGNDGIAFEGATDTTLDIATVTGAGGNGIVLRGSNTVTINNASIVGSTGDGVLFDAPAVDRPSGTGNSVTNAGGAVCAGAATNSTLIVNGQPCP